jgi:DNA-binding NarL/FixJ family response regulator
MSAPPVAAVVTDMVELLKAKLEQAGFVVLVMHVADIRQGLDIETTLKQHDPKVIIYDIVAPYDRSWRFLNHLRETTAFAGRQFVLTSPNTAQVRRIVGSDEMVYEIVGETEVDAIVQAAREASRARPTK